MIDSKQKTFNWEMRSGRTFHYLQVSRQYVTVGHHDGSKESDVAGSCTLDDFVNGVYQDLVVRTFGDEILNEVLTVVGDLLACRSRDDEPIL